MRLIGEFEGATIGVEWRDGRQVIIVSLQASLCSTRRGLAVRGFVDLLGADSCYYTVKDGEWRWEIVHDDQVDARLIELIDLLASIRYEHPTMLQLPLALDEEAAEALQEVLDL